MRQAWDFGYGRLELSVGRGKNVDKRSDKISLFNQLKIHDGKGEWIVPVFFTDNYFSLTPETSKSIEFDLPDGFSRERYLELNGWNTIKTE